MCMYNIKICNKQINHYFLPITEFWVQNLPHQAAIKDLDPIGMFHRILDIIPCVKTRSPASILASQLECLGTSLVPSIKTEQDGSKSHFMKSQVLRRGKTVAHPIPWKNQDSSIPRDLKPRLQFTSYCPIILDTNPIFGLGHERDDGWGWMDGLPSFTTWFKKF